MIDFPQVVDLDVDLPPGVDVGVGHPGQFTLSRGHAREVKISFTRDHGSTNHATEVNIFVEQSKISFTKKTWFTNQHFMVCCWQLTLSHAETLIFLTIRLYVIKYFQQSAETLIF